MRRKRRKYLVDKRKFIMFVFFAIILLIVPTYYIVEGVGGIGGFIEGNPAGRHVDGAVAENRPETLSLALEKSDDLLTDAFIGGDRDKILQDSAVGGVAGGIFGGAAGSAVGGAAGGAMSGAAGALYSAVGKAYGDGAENAEGGLPDKPVDGIPGGKYGGPDSGVTDGSDGNLYEVSAGDITNGSDASAGILTDGQGGADSDGQAGAPIDAESGGGPETAGNIVITLSAVGDCTLGYDETFGYQNRFDQVYASNGSDPAYFFQNVREILESDDLTIANLETTFTESTKKASKTYRFKGPPAYVKILEEGGVDAVNIANNHMFDYFQKGFDDTVETLTNSSVEYFGYDKRAIIEIRGVKIGLAGFHIGGGGWSNQKKAVTDALEYLHANADLVVISFHWGIEGNYKPSGDQRSLAHYSIDNGADLVLGHHPHTLQNLETYNGRTIIYSLGNFCFGGNRNPKDKDTIILRQSFEFDAETASLVNIREPEIIPASVSSVKDRNDYKPTVVAGADAERVLKKVLG